MLGQWEDHPSDPAYYIEDCRILSLTNCTPQNIWKKNWKFCFKFYMDLNTAQINKEFKQNIQIS